VAFDDWTLEQLVERARESIVATGELHQYEIDTTEVAEVWRRGSVVGSWLLDLTAEALCASPRLEEFAGRVSDSGEGRWTSIAAIDVGVPAPVLTTALIRASPRAVSTTSPTSCSRRCARSSADTTRRQRDGAAAGGPPRRRRGAERAAAFVAERAGAAAADHGRFTFAGQRRAHAVGDVRPPG
jgi:6-phosphogluconate dehydrogenase